MKPLDERKNPKNTVAFLWIRAEELTVEDVNAAVRRHLQADHLAIAIVTSDAEGFRDVLLSDEPPSITYNTEVSDDILGEDEEGAAEEGEEAAEGEEATEETSEEAATDEI